MGSEIPQKLVDWLLVMGCPPDKIPSIDKVKQMCRGDYALVWKCLMEKVQPKHTIKQKRLQVFVDDFKRLNIKNKLQEKEIKVPLELEIWQEHKELEDELYWAESGFIDKKQELKKLMGKVGFKASQRAAVLRRIEDAKRRSLLLERKTEELESLKENLIKMQDIAVSFKRPDVVADVQVKLDKCVTLLSKQEWKEANPQAASTSMVSMTDASDSDLDEQLSTLMSIPSDSIWNYLYEGRAALARQLSAANSLLFNSEHASSRGITAQSVLARSAALHCSLVMENVKNQKTIASLDQKLVKKLNEYHSVISEDGRELLLLRCEKAKGEARNAIYRTLLEDLSASRNSFDAGKLPSTPAGGTLRHIERIDRSMVSKKNDLERLNSALLKAEQRIQNVKNNLLIVFRGLQKDSTNMDRLMDGDMSLENFKTTLNFYDQRRNRNKKMELSLNLDSSDTSFDDAKDNNEEKKFSDELKLYLKNFNLEKNRKIVLESGQILWSFESLQECSNSLLRPKCNEDATRTFFSSYLTIYKNVENLINFHHWYKTMEEFLKQMTGFRGKIVEICDIKTMTREGDEETDKQKKRLDSNLTNLKNINKHINQSQENIRIYAANKFKKYISDKRTVSGRSYDFFEGVYLENLNTTV